MTPPEFNTSSTEALKRSLQLMLAYVQALLFVERHLGSLPNRFDATFALIDRISVTFKTPSSNTQAQARRLMNYANSASNSTPCTPADPQSHRHHLAVWRTRAPVQVSAEKAIRTHDRRTSPPQAAP